MLRRGLRKSALTELGLPLLAAGVVGGLLLLERRFSLERAPFGRQRRRTNAALGLMAAAITSAIEMPLTSRVARHVERRRWGIARLQSRAWRTLLSALWLDYSLYLWHRAAHEWLPLWRFHLPHHLDPTLDATSSWRFHVLELPGAMPPRLLLIRIAGVPRHAVRTWQELLLMSIAFHHSNLRLPERFESRLGLLIMTPRLHRIHHSARHDERASSWSSGLSLWAPPRHLPSRRPRRRAAPHRRRRRGPDDRVHGDVAAAVDSRTPG